MARSTAGPEWNKVFDKGGYTVQPVPTPPSVAADATRRRREGGSSQKLILFIRGNVISGADSIRGTNQFPRPPMNTGITRKKIIKKAWAVTKTL
jgi:hypothetical protein